MLSLLLAILIGISLGLLGGGGSTLAVPILVYVGGLPAKAAIATSLLVVGTTSLIGAVRHWRHGNVALRMAVLFGLVSMAGSYAGGRFAAYLSDRFQLVLFAVVMLAVAASMFRAPKAEPATTRLFPVAAAAAGGENAARMLVVHLYNHENKSEAAQENTVFKRLAISRGR